MLPKLVQICPIQDSMTTLKHVSKSSGNFMVLWAVVVAQLVEWLLLIPEVRGSNPVIGKNLFIY